MVDPRRRSSSGHASDRRPVPSAEPVFVIGRARANPVTCAADAAPGASQPVRIGRRTRVRCDASTHVAHRRHGPGLATDWLDATRRGAARLARRPAHGSPGHATANDSADIATHV